MSSSHYSHWSVGSGQSGPGDSPLLLARVPPLALPTGSHGSPRALQGLPRIGVHTGRGAASTFKLRQLGALAVPSFDSIVLQWNAQLEDDITMG